MCVSITHAAHICYFINNFGTSAYTNPINKSVNLCSHLPGPDWGDGWSNLTASPRPAGAEHRGRATAAAAAASPKAESGLCPSGRRNIVVFCYWIMNWVSSTPTKAPESSISSLSSRLKLPRLTRFALSWPVAELKVFTLKCTYSLCSFILFPSPSLCVFYGPGGGRYRENCRRLLLRAIDGSLQDWISIIHTETYKFVDRNCRLGVNRNWISSKEYSNSVTIRFTINCPRTF